MFIPKQKQSKLQLAIDKVLIDMSHHSATTNEYAKLLERLKDLHKMKEAEKPHRPSSDVMIQSAVYLIGIGMIIRHEEFNIITSKALAFMPRVR